MILLHCPQKVSGFTSMLKKQAGEKTAASSAALLAPSKRNLVSACCMLISKPKNVTFTPINLILDNRQNKTPATADSTVLNLKPFLHFFTKSRPRKIDLALKGLGYVYIHCPRDNQIDIVLAGDDDAVRAITAVEIPSTDGYLPLYNPGGPGNDPTPGVRYAAGTPPISHDVWVTLDDPVTVSIGGLITSARICT